jgi:hypothetical protein
MAKREATITLSHSIEEAENRHRRKASARSERPPKPGDVDRAVRDPRLRPVRAVPVTRERP